MKLNQRRATNRARVLQRRRGLLLAAASGAALMGGDLAAAQTGEATTVNLEEVIVTATARPEDRARLAATVQVIDPIRIERSTSQSVTDLLAESAVVFVNQWTPAQTQVNLRGGATEGQGRDFRSQVAILVNGRRAGTANISKLSPFDLARVEVVRGPASVVYGSQNIGGVINLITKTGQTAPGNVLQGTIGDWGLRQGFAQTGGELQGVDWYLGVSSGESDSYDGGSGSSGEMENTQWKRRGVTAAVGMQFTKAHRLELSMRWDGIYDAGFRGSGGNIYNLDNRHNKSADVTYLGDFGDRFGITIHGYAVHDADDLKWRSPVQRGGTGLPTPGTSQDDNDRQLDIVGSKFQPQLNLFPGNQLLIGWDWENSVLRSDRVRAAMPGQPALAQISPLDNNQSDTVHGFYAEDAQTFLDERLTIRGGVRFTRGKMSFDFTPNLAGAVPRTVEYDNTTWSAGATFRVTPSLTLRAGGATGFRTPTASELAADFTALGGGRVFGDPNLKPESARQIELGALYTRPAWRIDTAVFENVISDRIITRVRPNVANTSDYANNTNDIVVRGVEAQFDTDVMRLMGNEGGAWRWNLYASGSWNFNMKDKGAPATANTFNVTRMYRAQFAIGTRLGTGPWTLGVNGAWKGPVYYDTEENLLMPSVETFREFIHRKAPFWVWNARADFAVTDNVTVFGAVNNIFDKNYHPLFIAIDETPTKADLRFYNGSGGTSAPGRQFQAGVRLRF